MTDAGAPTYTKIPNEILEAMPTMGDAELRVVLAIARKTVGWQKECDVISVSQLALATGLTPRNTQRAITALLEKGLITREPAGKQTYCYTLATISLRDTVENHIPTDTMSLGDMAPYPLGTRLDDKPYPLGITQKKESKEKKERSRAPSAAPAEKSPHQQIMAAYQEALGYPIKDGAKEGNAAKWLVKNGYTPEQVTACYQSLRDDPWWEGKHISLQTVAGKIGAWSQAQQRKAEPRPIPQPTRPAVPDGVLSPQDAAARIIARRNAKNGMTDDTP